MHVIAAFDSNLHVEIALENLKNMDIEDNRIVIVEMQMNTKDKQIVDTMNHSNGNSLLDSVAAWSVIGATLGCIYGSVLRVGPIIIGLLGALFFGLVGFLLDKIIKRKHKKNGRLPSGSRKKYYDMLIIIRCNSKQEMKTISSICKDNNALSWGVNFS